MDLSAEFRISADRIFFASHTSCLYPISATRLNIGSGSCGPYLWLWFRPTIDTRIDDVQNCSDYMRNSTGSRSMCLQSFSQSINQNT